MRLLISLSLVGSLVAGSSAAEVGGTEATRAAAPIAADTVREYRGTYESGFEVSWFHPCDAEAGDDSWWVTLTADALKQRDSLATKLPPVEGQKPRAVFVRWRGTRSDKLPMGAGHMGRGSRYMLVHEVLDVRPATGAGCSSA